MDAALIEVMDGVQNSVRITEPYKLASGRSGPKGPSSSSALSGLAGMGHLMAARARRRAKNKFSRQQRRVQKAGAKYSEAGPSNPELAVQLPGAG